MQQRDQTKAPINQMEDRISEPGNNPVREEEREKE